MSLVGGWVFYNFREGSWLLSLNIKREGEPTGLEDLGNTTGCPWACLGIMTGPFSCSCLCPWAASYQPWETQLLLRKQGDRDCNEFLAPAKQKAHFLSLPSQDADELQVLRPTGFLNPCCFFELIKWKYSLFSTKRPILSGGIKEEVNSSPLSSQADSEDTGGLTHPSKCSAGFYVLRPKMFRPYYQPDHFLLSQSTWHYFSTGWT